ncbi:hypothetical protein [Desulfosporosinus shakirovi]|uniref:hypothetical protein n=1 Tax=Desulfosporosinus shakirovi TaxID=2885154 RepID=UPI001E4AC72F|nr:hypothetical protein [Desulfosporosinus sp. SRJS8]MCB8815446.1 hypothetical protein [Desulfosporosinus sp. SRJS8]
MNLEINEKLEQTQRGIARLHRIDSILKQLELEQDNLESKESGLKVILEKENYDAERLEHKSVASVFYSILGSLNEHVEKERREALAAKLRYDQAAKDLKDVNYQISKLSSERLGYVDCQKEYDHLCAKKKEELMRENGETAQKILELTDKANLTRINLQEINEALSAGNRVLDSLDSVLSTLESAEGWGTWDLLGGGLISDLAKHSHIDDAKVETENIQRLLRQFKIELTDVSISSEIVIETEGFAKFADFFFDGLIADWFMQSKINESQASVERVKSQVLNIVAKLEHMIAQGNANLERLEAEIRELIVKG